MTMHKALHPTDDVDRYYVSRKEGGRGRTSIKNGVDASIQRLEDYIKKRGGRQFTAIRNNSDNVRINWTKIAKKQNWEENSMDILGE